MSLDEISDVVDHEDMWMRHDNEVCNGNHPLN